MRKFDHLAIQVSNLDASRAWWRDALGLTVEMDNPGFCSLKDDADFAVFLGEVAHKPETAGLGLWLQVDDVEAFHREKSAAGIHFDHPPEKTMWGYGAELSDPDGHKLYVWDDATMKAKG